MCSSPQQSCSLATSIFCHCPNTVTGFGSGLNLPHYAVSVDRIVVVDTNPAVWQYAERTAAALGLPPGRLQLVTGSAEQLPLGDDSMDAVVSTHVS